MTKIWEVDIRRAQDGYPPCRSQYNIAAWDSCDAWFVWVQLQQGRTCRCRHMSLVCPTASLLRWDSLDPSDSMRLTCCIIARPMWGNCDLLHTYIDLSNFCHFLRNNDSKYCFFSCNRCSFQLKRGHLSTFRAYLIFLHRASKALSRAANSFMLVSWSRLLRNIHS